PTAAITFPTASGYNSAGWGGSSGAITGTASDNGGSGLTSVKVSVRDTTAGKCANASGSFSITCASNNQFQTTGGTPASWTFAIPAANLTTGDTYAVVVQTTDALGNTANSAASASWSYDNTAPSSATLSTNGAYNAAGWPGSISGTVSDSV